MRIAGSAVRLFLARVFNAGIGFLALAFVARVLDPGAIGGFFLFMSLLGILSVPADFGVREGLTKRLSQEFDDPSTPGHILGSSIGIKLMLLSALSLIILLFKNTINIYLGSESSYILVAALIAQELYMTVTATLRGELRIRKSAILEAANKSIGMGGGALFVLFGWGAKGLMYGVLLGFILSGIWGIKYVETFPHSPGKTYIKSLFDYSKYSFVTSVGGKIFSWTDILLIGFFLTQSHVGGYEIAWRIAGLTILFNQAVTTTLFPEISRIDSTEDRKDVEKIVSAAVIPLLMTIIPAFAGSLLLSGEILSVLFGSSYAFASTVLIIHIGGKIIQTLHLLIADTLRAMNMPNLTARSRIVAIIINIILNVSLIQILGITGAAIATTLAMAANLLMNYRYIRSYITLNLPIRSLLWIVISAGLMLSSVYYLKSIVHSSAFLELSLCVLFGIIVYSSVVVISPQIRYHLQSAMSH